jgi:hypothetical protein
VRSEEDAEDKLLPEADKEAIFKVPKNRKCVLPFSVFRFLYLVTIKISHLSGKNKNLQKHSET